VTPRELATVYGTLANGGTRPAVHGLATVVAPAGEAVAGPEPPEPHRVLQAQPAYLVTSVLQGVLDRGTAAGARSQGVLGELAGKTGTTNGRRDNWFAGYSPDRVTVVWVGYDDNAKSRLSGSSAALPIWSRFVRAMRPAQGYPAFAVPAGIVKATVDPTTGQLATPSCPYVVTDLFLEWKAPVEPCTVHQPGGVLADGVVGTEPWQSASFGQPAANGDADAGADAGAKTGDIPALPAQPGDEQPGKIVIRRSQGARTPEVGVRPAPAESPAPADKDDANTPTAVDAAEDPAPADDPPPAPLISPAPPPPGTPLEVLPT
ncbi:MAG: penicillin-binding protein, partial [Acidobacteriota bacterium]|nr:penicillin-binding protein [Acidobacteriota bacterium]